MSYKARIRAKTTQCYCIKIPLGLRDQRKNIAKGSLREEIAYLNLVHKHGGNAENDKALECIVKPLMPNIRLFNNEPLLVMKCYDRTLHELNHDKKVTLTDL